jgi:hypothetical protein
MSSARRTPPTLGRTFQLAPRRRRPSSNAEELDLGAYVPLTRLWSLASHNKGHFVIGVAEGRGLSLRERSIHSSPLNARSRTEGSKASNSLRICCLRPFTALTVGDASLLRNRVWVRVPARRKARRRAAACRPQPKESPRIRDWLRRSRSSLFPLVAFSSEWRPGRHAGRPEANLPAAEAVYRVGGPSGK